MKPQATHRLLACLAAVSMTMPVMAQTTTGTIDLDTDSNWTIIGSATTYANNNYTEAGWNFTSTNTIRNTTSTQDGFPGALGKYAWRLRNAAGSQLVATYTDTMTVASFGFDVRRWDGSPSPDVTVDYSTDAGASFNNIGITINNAYVDDSSDWKTLTYTLPSPTAVSAGQFIVRATVNIGERIIIDNFQWTFESEVDETAPGLVSLSPENDFSAALTNTSLVVNYDEPVIAGTSGSLTVFKTSDNSVVETISLPSEQVSTSGSAGIVRLSTQLEASTSYYVDVDAGFFTDAATNPAPAISGTTEWSFTTRGAPQVLISQYYEGAGTDRYIELKNLTGSPLALDGYSLAAWSNSDPAGREGWKSGAETTTRITDLTGQTIPANGNFLIAETAVTAPAYAAANNDLLDNGGCTAINGDDSVVLYFSGVDPLGFTLAEVVDAISIRGTEGTNTSFYRLSDGPGFDFTPGSSITDYSAVWGQKTNAEVDAAADTDEWYLKASTQIESLTLSLSPSSVAESAGLAASVATVTRSGSTSGAVFVTIASSNTSAAAEEGLAGLVEIPDGQASATFNIDVIDNDWLFGGTTVTFTVSATGYLPDSAELTITDDPGDASFPVVINEVDADTVGTDADEFVELYNTSGSPVSLDGCVLVLYNGGVTNDLSYSTIDLTGHSIPANGFFVVGSATVPNVNLVAFTSNGIQNGADAIALWYASAAAYPNNTPVTAVNGVLIDALVHDTNDADDTALLAALTPGKPQINESENAANETESMSRVPDGGAAFDTTLYVMQPPTPGATNVLAAATFATWAAENGIANEPLDGDFDLDGISNGIEYAIAGLNPALPDAAPGSFADGVLSFSKRAEAVANGDVIWQIEESSDLGISDPWTVVTPDTDDASVISYTLPTGLGKVFARLKVTPSAP